MSTTELPVFSHTKIGTFDQCEFLFYVGYDLNYGSVRKSPAMLLGDYCHKLLEAYYNKIKEGENTSVAFDAMRQRLMELAQNGADLAILDQAGKLIIRYLERFAPFADEEWEVLEVEYHFEFVLETPKGRKFVLQGYIDLIARNRKTGKVWVWDHKITGKQFLSPMQAMMDAQLPTYLAALINKGGYDLHGMLFNQIKSYVHKKATPAIDQIFKREETTRTELELDAFLYNLGLAVDRILDYREAKRFPVRSLNKDTCNYCWLNETCLFNMKGMDLMTLLSDPDTFAQKGVDSNEEIVDTVSSVPDFEFI